MITKPDFEMKQILFVFPTKGDKISFSNDNIIIKDNENNIKHQSTCYRLFMVCIVGDITLTSGIIRRAKKFGFTICLMTGGMKLYQIIGSTMEGNTLLHRKQYLYSGDALAKCIVTNKIINQRDAIRNLRIKSELAGHTVIRLNDMIDRIALTKDHNGLLGIEGNAAQIYFKEIFSTAEWNGRQPRIKRDYINSTLDIGYTILFNFIDALLGIYDFDRYCGVLHKSFYMRKSLVCDLMETMRPLIDLQVRKGINYGQIKRDDFVERNKRIVLKWEKSPQYTALLLKPIIEHKLDIFLYIQGYYRCFMKGLPEDRFPRFLPFRKEGM